VTLSKHQHAALVALVDGPRRVTEVAAAIGTSWSTAAAIVKALCERGLIKVIGIAGAKRQTPKTYTYELTTAGRAAAREAA
jgi:DNA-binding MarR family transcriptional regulator